MRTPTATTAACSCLGETERALRVGHEAEKRALRTRLRELDDENDALVAELDDVRRQLEQARGLAIVLSDVARDGVWIKGGWPA